MNDFYTVVANKAIDTLVPILIVWLVALAHLAIAWLKKRNLLADADLIVKQIETKQGWAYDAVLAVEDAYKELGGPDKLQKAIGKVVAKAQAHGFPYTLDEIEDYVRTAYQEIVAGVSQALATQPLAALPAVPDPDATVQLSASDTPAAQDTTTTPAAADPPPQAAIDTAPAQAVPDAAVQVANDTATPAQDASAAEVAPVIPILDPVAIAQAAAQEAQSHAQAAADAAARAVQAVAQVTQAS